MLEKDFYLGGRAIFTVTNLEDGSRATFEIKRALLDGPTEWFFAALLTGPDNERDYTYLGRVIPSSGLVMKTRKTPEGMETSPAWKKLQSALDWGWGENDHGVTTPRRHPELAEIQVDHAGRCSRCGRTLTDPGSIERGIGPVCVEAIR